MTAAHGVKNRPGTATLFLLLLLAAVLFASLFTFSPSWLPDFWWRMSFNIVLMLAVFFTLDRAWPPILLNDLSGRLSVKVFYGAGSAAFLYFIFLAGNYMSRLMLPFAAGDISAVYGLRGSASGLRIFLLLSLLIGPGEELLWRGFFQRQFSARFGRLPGFFITGLAYTGVHLLSCNIMLACAAFACGFFWGYLYMRYDSMVVNCVSHTLWDITSFMIAPFG